MTGLFERIHEELGGDTWLIGRVTGSEYAKLPGPIADIAYQNKAVVYDRLLKLAAETLITIAADPKHLGARIGLTPRECWRSAEKLPPATMI